MNVTKAVLDASALIALLGNEPGAEKVMAVLGESCISSVNLAEILGKMSEYKESLEAVSRQIERLDIMVIPFDTEQAKIAASFWKVTRPAGLSLGDRACLALAKKLSLPAYTTDKEWLKCDIGVKVVKIR
jgi:ribonuclease VapC